MTTPEEIRDLIMATQPSGTLRCWGDWFGRPYDKAHRIVSVAVDAHTLLIGMDGDELLSVTNPSGVDVATDRLRIERADRVAFEWFAYGQPRESANRYCQEHWVEGDRVRAISNVHRNMPRFSPSIDEPAVELQ
jgi:hypothetical protein